MWILWVKFLASVMIFLENLSRKIVVDVEMLGCPVENVMTTNVFYFNFIAPY